MSSRWEQYKEKMQGNAKPWDLLDPHQPRVSESVKEERYSTCHSCERFIPITTQCKECGCIMKLKTTLLHASCPLNKW